MNQSAKTALPATIEETIAMLEANDYLAGRSLATVVFLALQRSFVRGILAGSVK